MRSLAQPKVLGRAALAGLVTSLVCCPRIALWTNQRAGSVFSLWLILLWAMVIMWSFVFAWHEKYTSRPPLNFDFPPGIWAIGTAYAIIIACLDYARFDPRLCLIVPGEYPVNMDWWVAMTLFSLGFEPLFFCFAPYALFMRLARRPEAALALTVLFSVFVFALRLSQSPTLPPLDLIAVMILLRVVGSFMGVYFYLKGGAFLNWWIILVIQLRHLVELSTRH